MLSMITDDTSKTFWLAETHETPQSAWIDGSRTLGQRGSRPGHGQQHTPHLTPHLDGHVGQVNSEIDTNPSFSVYPQADRVRVAEAP